MVSTLRLYNAYKEFSEIDSTQLCNNAVISIVLFINHGYTTIREKNYMLINHLLIFLQQYY